MLLERALDVFLEHGFERSTTEEIATAAGMSKRTVYARYPDKAALFRAAVKLAVDRYAIQPSELEAAVSADLAQTLKAIGRIRIANLRKPNSIKLQRVLSAQAYRFPDLYQASLEEGAGPTLQFLAQLLARRAAAGEIDVPEPHRAATAFLGLAAGAAARLSVAGRALQDSEIDAHLDFAVRLFLYGVARA